MFQFHLTGKLRTAVIVVFVLHSVAKLEALPPPHRTWSQISDYVPIATADGPDRLLGAQSIPFRVPAPTRNRSGPSAVAIGT